MKKYRGLFLLAAIAIIVGGVKLLTLAYENCKILRVSDTITVGQGYTEYGTMHHVCTPPVITATQSEISIVIVVVSLVIVVLFGLYAYYEIFG